MVDEFVVRFEAVWHEKCHTFLDKALQQRNDDKPFPIFVAVLFIVNIKNVSTHFLGIFLRFFFLKRNEHASFIITKYGKKSTVKLYNEYRTSLLFA